jgi:ATP-dependent Clp protease ATP-binding subunit ClpC
VILFDEIEKAHPDAFNMLLQIMEEGHLTDSYGRKVDFKNTIVIMTSNIGAEVIKNQTTLGFARQAPEVTFERMREELMREVEKHFRPEFLNRLDEVIVFHPLSRADLRQIVEIEVRHVAERLEQRHVSLALTDEAKEFLIDNGFNPEFGARPLRRAVQRLLEDPLSEEVLRGGFTEGTTLRVTVHEGHLRFETGAPTPPPPPPEKPKAAAATS